MISKVCRILIFGSTERRAHVSPMLSSLTRPVVGNLGMCLHDKLGHQLLELSGVNLKNFTSAGNHCK